MINSSLKSSNKGNTALETVAILVVVVITAIIVWNGYKVYNELNTEIQADLTGKALEEHNDMYSSYPSIMDKVVPTIIILLWIGVVIASTMIDTHPIFFGISIFILIFVLIGAAIISNTAQEIMDDQTFSEVQDNFPLTYWSITHLVQIIMVIGFSVMISLYAKRAL